jgi:hypothetical protein
MFQISVTCPLSHVSDLHTGVDHYLPTAFVQTAANISVFQIHEKSPIIKAINFSVNLRSENYKHTRRPIHC